MSSWRKIPITLIDVEKGETNAHACVIACYRYLTCMRVYDGHGMEDQPRSARVVSRDSVLDEIVPLWMKIILGAVFSSFAVIGVWRHGLRNGDSLMLVAMLGIFFFPSHRTEIFGRNLRWPLRVVFVLWVIAFSAWLAHIWGWLPALAFGGLSLMNPSKGEDIVWKAYFQKPQNVIRASLFAGLIFWFARDTNGWVPIGCVVATFLLLERNTSTRRSLRDNLKRPSVAALAAIAIFAAVWAWLHWSFWNVAALMMVIILASSDIYLHTEEDPALTCV